ncbi:GTPase IMAP family member 7-like [Scleropages formosus]|uniref:GTPase IMAP family member 7-like n=1 Tax=Scleropages formosus TaxID=113540 RepID=A0A0P7V3F1_SCLFO|nr:GTPase IMAP family member 7-like [Scleropages formosus]
MEMESGRPQNVAENSTPLLTSVPPELRLVLLGRSGSGKSAAGNTILGVEAFVTSDNSRVPVTQECEKREGAVAGRKVVLVDTPDFFYSERPLEVVQHQIAACMALSSPGPHAFLLCVPVDRPAGVEVQVLEAVEEVFGPGAVKKRMLVLFTHFDRLGESDAVEEHIISHRRDLVALTESCGDRYHMLQRAMGEMGDEISKGSVESLLDKVDEIVRECEDTHHCCSPPREVENAVRQGQEDAVRERQRGARKDELELKSSSSLHSEKKVGEERDQTQEEGDDSGDELSPATVASLSSSRNVSMLRFIWETVMSFMWRLPKLIRLEAFMGAVIGLFVGGPYGGALGTTVSSVATEVGKRKGTKQK